MLQQSDKYFSFSRYVTMEQSKCSTLACNMVKMLENFFCFPENIFYINLKYLHCKQFHWKVKWKWSNPNIDHIKYVNWKCGLKPQCSCFNLPIEWSSNAYYSRYNVDNALFVMKHNPCYVTLILIYCNCGNDIVTNVIIILT